MLIYAYKNFLEMKQRGREMKKLFFSALVGTVFSVYNANAFSFLDFQKHLNNYHPPQLEKPVDPFKPDDSFSFNNPVKELPKPLNPHKDEDKKDNKDRKHILVKFKESAPYKLIKQILADAGIDIEKYFKNTDIFLLKLPEGFPVEEAIKFLKGFDFVKYAEPDIVFKLSTKEIPNDPLFSKQWGLNNSSDRDIDAPEGWSKETGNGKVIIGIIDTGVDYNHEDLRKNIWTNSKECNGIKGVDDDGNGYVDDCHGWNAVDNNGNPLDDNGHGTHVAGIAAAVGNNGKGITGVNWNAKILPLKFMRNDGRGNLSDAIECIEYVIDNIKKGRNIKVVNASWGEYQSSSALRDAIRKLRQNDVLFVAAAGNDKNNNDAKPFYPASYDLDNIIAVAATDKNDNLASFSNYGKNSVDVAAPGVDIISTYPENKYRYMSGTSMATPFVTGLASLIWSEKDGYSYKDVKNIIENNGDKLSSLSGVIKTSSRINADKSLKVQNNPVIKEPDLRVKPESYDYGKVETGKQEKAKFTLNNVGNKILEIFTMYIEGEDHKNFKIVENNCPPDLDPGKSCSVVVRFAPENDGVKKANFVVETNDPDESIKKVPLKGEGVSRDSGFFDFLGNFFSMLF